MVLTGDYIVPQVNGRPFFEKPPLVYWAGAAFYQVLGRSELTTRLPSALATVALTLLLYRIGSARFGRRAGILAAFFFVLSPIVFGSARQLTTDAVLNLCIAGALFSYYVALRSQSPARHRWFYLCSLCMALGVLAKGLPGIIIPLLTIGVHWILAPRVSDPAQLALSGKARAAIIAVGVLLFLAAAVPWHILAYRAAGEAFTAEYIIRQHIGRFRGGDVSHLAPFWFFVPGFLAGAFPWSFFLPAALVSRSSVDDSSRGDFRIFLKVWAVLVFLLFSASGSKLISYILPMYAPAALLVGDWAARAIERKEARRALLWGGGIAFALALLLLGVIAFSTPIIQAIEASSGRPVRMDQVPPGALRWAGHLFFAAALAAGLFCGFVLANRRKEAFAAMAAGMSLFVAFGVFEGLPLIDRSLLRPLHEAARFAGEQAAAKDLPLIVKTSGARRPSVLFYLPDTLVRQGRVEEVRDADALVQRLAAGEVVPSILLVDRALAGRIEELPAAGPALLTTPGWTVLETASTK